MTVCIAAICQLPGQFQCVLGATDRQLTAGDIQFEPPLSKVWQFTPNIAALIAGDAGAQGEVCTNVWRRQPKTCEEAVDFYCRELGAYNTRQAERRVLFPFGLNMKSFLADKDGISPDFIDTAYNEIKRTRAHVSTIICGVDQFGARLVVIDETGVAHDCSSIGFAAIGDGKSHALSQFMFSRYTRDWSLAKSLLLLYSAKQRAQVAPGVGLETDLFLVAPPPGHLAFIHEPFIGAISDAYKKQRKAVERAVATSYGSIESHVEKLVKQAAD